jgi:hypothetical protein
MTNHDVFELWLHREVGMLSLLCCGQQHVEWCFTEDENDIMAVALPPLPHGAYLKLRTLPANGDSDTGGRIWQSAPVLCRWLRGFAAQVHGSAVLELGSGTGACGIYCAGLGAARVVLTDGGSPALLALAAQNARAATRISPKVAAAAVEVRTLTWGCEADQLPTGYFRWILGSDIIYDDTAHDALCRSLQQLLQRRAQPCPGAGEPAEVPRAVMCTMPRQRVKVSDSMLSDASNPSVSQYSEAALLHFAAVAAKYDLQLTPVTADDVARHSNTKSTNHSPTPRRMASNAISCGFHWSGAEFRELGPILFEVSERESAGDTTH